MSHWVPVLNTNYTVPYICVAHMWWIGKFCWEIWALVFTITLYMYMSVDKDTISLALCEWSKCTVPVWCKHTCRPRSAVLSPQERQPKWEDEICPVFNNSFVYRSLYSRVTITHDNHHTICNGRYAELMWKWTACNFRKLFGLFSFDNQDGKQTEVSLTIKQRFMSRKKYFSCLVSLKSPTVWGWGPASWAE